MRDIQITLNKLDAEALLPMILEQTKDRLDTVRGGYWLSLHAAITAALALDASTA
jgi:hypothetical protein